MEEKRKKKERKRKRKKERKTKKKKFIEATAKLTGDTVISSLILQIRLCRVLFARQGKSHPTKHQELLPTAVAFHQWRLRRLLATLSAAPSAYPSTHLRHSWERHRQPYSSVISHIHVEAVAYRTMTETREETT